MHMSLRLGLTTKLYTMNPKAVTVIELYGILDPITRDWTDGLLSNIFREINRPTEKNERKYILFDGDVDALWVENMNSVMDDNKLLTLANGERIRLQKHCALLVEVSIIMYVYHRHTHVMFLHRTHFTCSIGHFYWPANAPPCTHVYITQLVVYEFDSTWRISEIYSALPKHDTGHSMVRFDSVPYFYYGPTGG